jgi:uncharacterized membrane-anchored protein YhcB (DUF1043 family)
MSGKPRRWSWIVAILALFCLAFAAVNARAAPQAHPRTVAAHHVRHHHRAAMHHRHHVRRGSHHSARHHRHHRRHHPASAATRAIANCTNDNVKRLKLTPYQTRHLKIGKPLETMLAGVPFPHTTVKGDTVWGVCALDISQAGALQSKQIIDLQTQSQAWKTLVHKNFVAWDKMRRARDQLVADNRSQHNWIVGFWVAIALLVVLGLIVVGLMFMRAKNALNEEKNTADQLKTRIEELNASNVAKIKAEEAHKSLRRDVGSLEELLEQALEVLRYGSLEQRDELAGKLANRKRLVDPVVVGDGANEPIS